MVVAFKIYQCSIFVDFLSIQYEHMRSYNGIHTYEAHLYTKIRLIYTYWCIPYKVDESLNLRGVLKKPKHERTHETCGT